MDKKEEEKVIHLLVVIRKQDDFNFTILRRVKGKWSFLKDKRNESFFGFENENYKKIGNGTSIKYWNKDGIIIKFFENKFLDLNLLKRMDLTSIEKSNEVFNLISKLIK